MKSKPEPARRRFLRHAAAAAVFPTVWSPRSTAASPLLSGVPARPGDPDAEVYWDQVRAQFAFREDKVPMNAANLCPSPRAVAERVSELTFDIDRDCSFNNRAKFRDMLEDSRAAVAKGLGVSPDEVALVRNTSEANNTINNGISLNEGDEIVLWDQNHPTNNVAWDVRAARFGLTVHRVSTPSEPTSEASLLEPFTQALTAKTKVLSVTHVSNVSGIKLPVKELVDAAHAKGIHVHLDGAQSWGALDLDLRAIGCDSYSASGHKWFMGPKEAGVLYVKSDRIPHIWPNVVAPGWGDDVDPDVTGARKFESLGQRDDACLAAVGTAASFHESIGSQEVQSRIERLAGFLKENLAELGAQLVTPRPTELSGGVVIMKVASEQRGAVLNTLYEDHGIAGSSSGGLRLCPHVYNTMEHCERAVAGVKALKKLWA